LDNSGDSQFEFDLADKAIVADTAQLFDQLT